MGVTATTETGANLVREGLALLDLGKVPAAKRNIADATTRDQGVVLGSILVQRSAGDIMHVVYVLVFPLALILLASKRCHALT